jgi:hypothetical protein
MHPRGISRFPEVQLHPCGSLTHPGMTKWGDFMQLASQSGDVAQGLLDHLALVSR